MPVRTSNNIVSPKHRLPPEGGAGRSQYPTMPPLAGVTAGITPPRTASSQPNGCAGNGAPAHSTEHTTAARLALVDDRTIEAAVLQMIRELVARAERAPTPQERLRRLAWLENFINSL